MEAIISPVMINLRPFPHNHRPEPLEEVEGGGRERYLEYQLGQIACKSLLYQRFIRVPEA